MSRKGNVVDDHFAWSGDGTLIIGTSGVGRATVEALNMNHDPVIELRELWEALWLHPRNQ